MENIKDIDWFKQNLTSSFKNYELNYRFFEEGDFGSLDQVEFNSSNIGGAIDFWGLGWIGVYVWDNVNEKELLNVLLEPKEESRIIETFNSLKALIRS